MQPPSSRLVQGQCREVRTAPRHLHLQGQQGMMLVAVLARNHRCSRDLARPQEAAADQSLGAVSVPRETSEACWLEWHLARPYGCAGMWPHPQHALAQLQWPHNLPPKVDRAVPREISCMLLGKALSLRSGNSCAVVWRYHLQSAVRPPAACILQPAIFSARNSLGLVPIEKHALLHAIPHQQCPRSFCSFVGLLSLQHLQRHAHMIEHEQLLHAVCRGWCDSLRQGRSCPRSVAFHGLI
mmetsp:Transcript_41974/g.98483  ORF Transcript_41974/g.98483 Transcript_41974/m.98483 type:complete len:240 (+) Transcript_41974:1000-1719(+)